MLRRGRWLLAADEVQLPDALTLRADHASACGWGASRRERVRQLHARTAILHICAA